MLKKIKPSQYFFICLALFFVLNSISSLLRYTDVYRLFLPSSIGPTLFPSLLKKNWYYKEMVENIPSKEKVAVLAPWGSEHYWEFHLYPRRIFGFNLNTLHKYNFAVLSQAGSDQYQKELTSRGFIQIATYKNEYRVWRRRP